MKPPFAPIFIYVADGVETFEKIVFLKDDKSAGTKESREDWK